jgi:exodeoxyribonuclease V beta subunit
VNALNPVTVPLASTTLIEASAGTGKTHTITTLYLRCLLEIPLDVRRILVVTYTNAATAELRERIRERIREAHAAFRHAGACSDPILAALLEASRTRDTVPRDATRLVRALQDFDEAAIFTIHGFCQRMLQENAFESRAPFEAKLAGEPVLLRDEVVRDFLATRLVEAPEPVVRAAARLGIESHGLERLARMAGSNPRLVVLPERVEPPGVEAAIAAWRAAFDRVTRIWLRERAEVIATLSDRQRMRGNLYRAEWVRAWAEAMDSHLQAGAAGLYQRLRIEKFTTAEVRKGAKGAPPQHELFEACDELLAARRDLQHVLERHGVWLRREFVDYARRELRRRKEEANEQSFDDLLLHLADALAGAGGVQLADAVAARFHAALIDEFQDTDPLQYEIFRRIYAGRDRPLFLIGDPKQAIYSFRGADVHTYMTARDDAGEHRHTLDTNYRSDARLIDAVNALFGGRGRPFLLDRIEFQPVRAGPDARDRLGGALAESPPFEILLAPEERIGRARGEEILPGLLAGEISRFLQSGATIDDRGVEAGDLAVLCRTNKQGSLVQRELQELYVPCVLQGDSSVFDTSEAEEVERVLVAIADPSDSSSVRGALATTMIGLDAADLAALQRDEQAWDARLRQFAAFGDTWASEGFFRAFRRLLDGLDVQTRLLERLDGERRLTNVLHLAELLQKASAEGHRGPLALIEWLRRMRRDGSARGDVAGEAEQIRLESDAKRVKVTTIHQAKGLEYPVVYCPFLWGSLFEKRVGEPLCFHDPERGWEAALDLGSEHWTEHKALAEFEELAENLRLLYVAVTRAKHRCTIVWGAFTSAPSSALGYVLHRPPNLRNDARLSEVVAEIAARTASLAAIREDLARLVREAGGAIGVKDFPVSTAPAYRGQPEPAGLLAPRPTTRPPLTTTWRVSSFTSLASGGGGLSEPAREGLDRDEGGDEALAEKAPAGRTVARRIILDEFPRGARTGDLVHEIFEHLDFTRAADADVDVEIARRLESYGLGAEWADSLCRSVREVVATPLGGAAGDLRLADVFPRQRLNEMEFVFPVAEASAALTPQALAATLGARWRVPPPDYPDHLARLRFQPVAGFLRGFVDLVFEHGGRWYVVDYKSSFLGPAPDDYRGARLVPAMARHHFLLQYHLYVVAVDRHLRQCVPGYDFDTHFGGVYYLFVRGMSPDHPRGYGVFHDRPARVLVEELSAMLTPERRIEGVT